MDPKIIEISKELQKLLGDCWTGVCITAGLNAGFFSILSPDKPVSIEEIAEKYGYESQKVEKWIYFAELNNFVKKSGDGYILDEKGKCFTQSTPFKDLLGFYSVSDYFLRAAVEAKETFKKNKSIDTISEGKISRDYQPKVSDNFSSMLVDFFEELKIGEKDTLLDFGCGHGSFLRTLSKYLPGVKFTGVDSNMFTVEFGKKENAQIGLNDRIELIVGDITTDMEEFGNDSYDWVVAINIFHFIQPNKRLDVVKNMMRIARKGALMTETIVEKTPMSITGNVLLPLIWNDATGFFKQTEADNFNQQIKKQFPEFQFRIEPFLQGTSYLVIATKSLK